MNTSYSIMKMVIKMKFGLSDEIYIKIKNIANKYNKYNFLIFGSRARGNFRNGSDVDFAIWTDNHEYFYRIWGELDELPTPYKFDVIDYKVLSHEGMKNSIDKDGIIFYEKI